MSSIAPTIRHLRRVLGGALVVSLALSPAVLAGQQRLVGFRTVTVRPTFDSWSFGDGGLVQPALDGSGSVQVERAAQWSLPLAATVPIGERLTLDVVASYASGTVHLTQSDTTLRTARYTLAGVTDVKLRATGRVLGDALLVTLGVNLPTGKKELDTEEFSALRVLAAPALSFAVPALGTGSGGTVGVVYARELAGWGWALGASYEMRGSYAPVTIAAGLPTPDFNPSDAVHLSVGGDGLIGRHGMTVALGVDVYTKDKLSERAPSPITPLPGEGGSESSQAGSEVTSQLGPIVTADWQLRLAVPTFRELTVYALERYRSSFKRAGVTVGESAGNYLDAGVRGVIPVAARTGVLVAVSGRHHSGIKADNTIATAAYAGGGLTLGAIHELQRGYALEPFVRGQLGRLEIDGRSSNARALSAGIALRAQF